LDASTRAMTLLALGIASSNCTPLSTISSTTPFEARNHCISWPVRPAERFDILFARNSSRLRGPGKAPVAAFSIGCPSRCRDEIACQKLGWAPPVLYFARRRSGSIGRERFVIRMNAAPA